MSESKGVIYLIRSKTTGKMYVGQTVQSFKERWNTHKREAFNKKSTSYNGHFHKAIRKYGTEDWECMIVQSFCCSSRDLLKQKLDEAETRYISYFNTFKEGYNSTAGGGGTIGFEPWNKGTKGLYSLSEKTKLKMSQNRSGDRNGMYGKHRTESEKDKIRKALNKPINQLDLDGNFIKRWNSIKEAMSAGYNNINYVINGKYKQSKGYKWEYARD